MPLRVRLRHALVSVGSERSNHTWPEQTCGERISAQWFDDGALMQPGSTEPEMGSPPGRPDARKPIDPRRSGMLAIQWPQSFTNAGPGADLVSDLLRAGRMVPACSPGRRCTATRPDCESKRPGMWSGCGRPFAHDVGTRTSPSRTNEFLVRQDPSRGGPSVMEILPGFRCCFSRFRWALRSRSRLRWSSLHATADPAGSSGVIGSFADGSRPIGED